ncbi:MAG: DUF2066 domain-containing protein [Gammaproteobacteria bacterium]|nr:DUF2066 domain-containing protein [Gammaproteobacteria bacterium]
MLMETSTGPRRGAREAAVQRIVWLALACCLIGAAQAGTVTDLYESRVAARSSGIASTEDLSAALRTVLRRVSGRRTVPDHPAIAAALAEPDALLLQQRYEAAVDGQQIAFTFDRKQVDGLLDLAGVRRWGSYRPTPLVWIAIEAANGERFLVGATESPDLSERLAQIADARGVPLIVPLLDLEDRSRVSADDAWSGSVANFQSSASRYGAEALAVARVKPALGGGWESHWTLFGGEFQDDWQAASAEELEDALVAGIHDTIDRLLNPPASKSTEATPAPTRTTAPAAPVPGAGGQAPLTVDAAAAQVAPTGAPVPDRTPAPFAPTAVGSDGAGQSDAPDATSLGESDVEITGIKTLGDFARAKDYLASLPIVSGVRLRRLGGGKAVFDVEVQGGVGALARSVGLGGVLRREDQIVDNRFQLVP